MIKRNILSIFIIGLIISAGAIATLITVRDYPTFIQELNNSSLFTNFPTNNNDDNKTNDNSGILFIYFESEIINSQTVQLVPEGDKSNNKPNSTTIAIHIWFTINRIELQSAENNNLSFIDKTQTIDLVAGVNDSQLLSVSNISEGTYKTIQIYYCREIVAQTDSGENITLSVQGSNFIVLPFRDNKGSHVNSNMKIEKGSNKELFLNFEFSINWKVKFITINMQAYLKR